MISLQSLQQLATRYQTSLFPNVLREYFQHLFLDTLYREPETKNLLFKGGTALRIIYGSPRFSEDLDFSWRVDNHASVGKVSAESLFLDALTRIEKFGVIVSLGEKSGATTGGYFGIATMQALDSPPVSLEVNVSERSNDLLQGEVDSIVSDFLPAYTLVHLSQEQLVDEKIFGALLNRHKPRDFYDLYFILRKGMLTQEQKKKLSDCFTKIENESGKINFKNELSVFLPANQQILIKDFARTLSSEIKRQIA